MKSRVIHLAKGLDIPLNVTTAKISFMGGNGSGKTYAATKIEEEILRAGGWLIVIDPVGIHYGLRLDSTGKKPSGLEIPIFGGHHGDVILTPESGAMIADLLCDRRLSAVLDVSEFTDPEMNKFATEFGIQFEKRMKAKHRAVTIALEECQEIIPQNPMKGEERKLHIWNRIAKIGRNYGIGVMMISARPQDINKKSLNLTQLMFAFQMTGTHERKAMEDWFTYSKYDAKIGDILPSLEVGEPYVMSPRMLKINKQFKIFPKTTFDASATPDFFEDNSKTISLNPIDISSLEEAMKKQIAEAKENDPKELRKEIDRLKREIAARPVHIEPKTEIKEVEVVVIPPDQIDALNDSLEEIKNQYNILSTLRDEIASAFQIPTDQLKETTSTLTSTIKQAELINQRRYSIGVDNSRGKDHTVVTKMEKRGDKVTVVSMDGITGPEQKILNSIAWFQSIGIYQPLQTAVASLCSYSSVSKTYTNPRASLNRKGLVQYMGRSIALTVAGQNCAQMPTKPLTVEEMQTRVMEVLTGPEKKILNYLLTYPEEWEKKDVADNIGYDVKSKTFTNPLSHLRTLGLVEYPIPHRVRAMPFLFLK